MKEENVLRLLEEYFCESKGSCNKWKHLCSDSSVLIICLNSVSNAGIFP